MAKIIAQRAASFPTGLEAIGMLVTQRAVNVGALLFDSTALEGDVGPLRVGMGRAGKGARRKRRGQNQFFHEVSILLGKAGGDERENASRPA